MIKQTWTGDSGSTKLSGGEATTKDSLRVDAYGDVDELNSFVGMARSRVEDKNIDAVLREIQNDLFVIGAELAKAKPNEKSTLSKERVEWIESIVKKVDTQLPDLTKFILPGGSPAAALLHISRSVARRAERKCVMLKRNEIVASGYRLGNKIYFLPTLTDAQTKDTTRPYPQKGLIDMVRRTLFVR